MLRIFRSAMVGGAAAVTLFAGTAIADNNWTITVNNKSKTPADVTILLNGSKVGDKKSAGGGGSTTISIPPKPGNYSWKAESGGKECGKNSISISGSRSIDVTCEGVADANSGSGSGSASGAGSGSAKGSSPAAPQPNPGGGSGSGSGSGSAQSGGCSLKDIGKDGCPSKTVQDLRKLRDEKERQLRSAEEDLKRNVDAAKSAKTKADIEKALKQADDARKRIDIFRKELGDLLPAEKINYTSVLPKEYEGKNPFDLIYDYASKTLCRGGKIQWDGTILSCQKGDTPDPGNRPIPPATDISPSK
jgi:flagellin-like hook-associated protein FlgL